MIEDVKFCGICETEKPMSEFHKSRATYDGLQSRCKQCGAETIQKYKATPHGRSIYKKAHRRFMKSPKGKIASLKHYAKYKEKWPARIIASKRLLRAIQGGKVIRPSSCSICGTQCKPEGHHLSYAPHHYLAVVWCCQFCHNTLHSLGGRKHEDISRRAIHT